MLNIRFEAAGRANPWSLCHLICLCSTWMQVAFAAPHAVGDNALLPRTGGLGLIPSALGPIDLVPSAPLPTSVIPSQPPKVIPSQPPQVIPSQSPQPTQIPSSPAPIGVILSASAPPGVISSAHPPASNPGLFPSAPRTTDAIPSVAPSQGIISGTPGMTSTDQGLKPVPPAATQIGDPNGHHEITEPNFTATKPCRGCSPVIEISATGWLDSPAEEQRGSTAAPAKATIPAGSSEIVVSQVASGGNFVIGGSTTLTAGQTIVVDNTPIAVQTSGGSPVVVVGSTTIPLHQPNEAAPEITDAPVPLPPVLTVGTQVLTPNAQTQYIIADQTLSPGGPALTISGTVVSLAPSATAIVVNGATSTVSRNYGNVYTTQMPAALNFHNQIFTANRAGYIVIGPGTTLIPGGSPITVDGTTLSLEHSGTAVVVQGTTSMLQPVTTIVTLTKSLSGGYAGAPSGNGAAHATNKPVSGGTTLSPSFPVTDGWFAGLLMLLWWGAGLLAIRL